MFPTDEETDLWVALNLTQRYVYRVMDSALRAEGLPRLRWYDVLWAVESAGEKGLRPNELEKSLLFEQSNLSRLIQRIVADGLLKETVYQADQRGKVLRITAKGRHIRKQMWQVYGPLIHSYLNKLSAGVGLAEVTSALNSLIERQD